MSDFLDDLHKRIPELGDPADTPAPDHDPTNGRWLEHTTADALERWGYLTARNEHLFGLETDVLARRQSPRNEPDDFIVGECKDWHTSLVGRDAVAAVSHRAALARAMPVLVVARGVTASAWHLAQQLDVRILTIEDLEKDGASAANRASTTRGNVPYSSRTPCERTARTRTVDCEPAGHPRYRGASVLRWWEKSVLCARQNGQQRVRQRLRH